MPKSQLRSRMLLSFNTFFVEQVDYSEETSSQDTILHQQQEQQQQQQQHLRRHNSPVLIIDHNEHSSNGASQRLPIITQYNIDANQQLALVSDNTASGGPLMEVEFYGEKSDDKRENLPLITQNGKLSFYR